MSKALSAKGLRVLHVHHFKQSDQEINEDLQPVALDVIFSRKLGACVVISSSCTGSSVVMKQWRSDQLLQQWGIRVSWRRRASCRMQMPRPDRRNEAVLMKLLCLTNHVECGVLTSSGLRKLFCVLASARSKATRRKKSLAQAAPSRGQPWALFSLCSQGRQHQPQPCLSKGLIYPWDHCPKDSLETLNTSAGTMLSLWFLPGNMAGADQAASEFQFENYKGRMNTGN